MFGSLRPRWTPVLALSLLAVCPAFAQLKVAVIASQAALSETARTDLEAKFKLRENEIAKVSKDLETINNQLSLGDKLTMEAQADLTVQGQKMQRQLQRLREDYQADLDREQGDIIARSSERMRQVIQKLAEEKGLDLVVEAGTTLYAKPTLDLTKEAVAAYDLAYPVK